MIEITAVDGHKFSAYRADPEGSPRGAVIVVQEIFGINAHIKKMADGFATRGYVALAPALFDRVKKDVSLGYDEAAIAQGVDLMKQVAIDTALADIQATVDVAKDAGKVAITGYCWGGYLAYLAANQVNGIACTIGYYGAGIADEWRGKRKVPTLLHFGTQDDLIPFEQVTQFRANRPDVTVFGYPAGHGFNCDERNSYDPQSATLAHERTLFWISQFVEGQPPIVLKNAGAYAQAKVDKKKKKPAGDDLGPPEA
ncbi:MAG: dienelactone hydrolase family protein [Rhizomicrobium sp.]